MERSNYRGTKDLRGTVYGPEDYLPDWMKPFCIINDRKYSYYCEKVAESGGYDVKGCSGSVPGGIVDAAIRSEILCLESYNGEMTVDEFRMKKAVKMKEQVEASKTSNSNFTIKVVYPHHKKPDFSMKVDDHHYYQDIKEYSLLKRVFLAGHVMHSEVIAFITTPIGSDGWIKGNVFAQYAVDFANTAPKRTDLVRGLVFNQLMRININEHSSYYYLITFGAFNKDCHAQVIDNGTRNRLVLYMARCTDDQTVEDMRLLKAMLVAKHAKMRNDADDQR